jgi:hypothetical protein
MADVQHFIEFQNGGGGHLEKWRHNPDPVFLNSASFS